MKEQARMICQVLPPRRRLLGILRHVPTWGIGVLMLAAAARQCAPAPEHVVVVDTQWYEDPALCETLSGVWQRCPWVK